MTTKDHAVAEGNHGRRLLPAKDRRKDPRAGFMWTKEATNNPETIASWFSDGDINYGVACGLSNLVVIDEDNLGELTRFCEDRGESLPKTRTVRTPHGRHFYFQQPKKRIKCQAPFKKDGYKIDVRGDGGYVIGPGSINTEGQEYVDEGGEIAPLPGFLAEYLTREPELAKAPPVERAPVPNASDDRPGTDWANQTSWESLLAAHGWHVHGDSATRPGKDPREGASATVHDDGGLYVFSTEAGLPTEQPLSKLFVYAHYNHGGDMSAAARHLRTQGYGRSSAADEFNVIMDLPEQLANGSQGKADAATTPEQEHQAKVLARAEQLRVDREAREHLDGEKTAGLEIPQLIRLDHFLAQPDETTPWRVEHVWPEGGRIVLSAQQKTGKTTTVGNTIRALVDGVPLFGEFFTRQADRVALLDLELSPLTLRRWLRDQNIENADRLDILALRGVASQFDILNPSVRTAWAKHIGGADVLVFDCLRPALDALALDENKDAGRFLEALDELALEAGITNVLLVHHMGHTGERSRGDSRILDWPDASWRLLKDQENENDSAAQGNRFFTAHGRDVDVPKRLLDYDPISRHLTIGQTRTAAKTGAALDAVLEYLGSSLPTAKTALVRHLAETTEHSRQALRDAISSGLGQYLIISELGDRGAKILSISEGGRNRLGSLPQVADSLPNSDPSACQIAAPYKGRQGGKVTRDGKEKGSSEPLNRRCNPCGEVYGPLAYNCPKCGEPTTDPEGRSGDEFL
ncbi:bifunctional DNA primase/polymerase [Schaalia sp. JY-X169]|uniref:bifunctional DNA primase/polymerase n=1 Tax=Schaalia sp. JY-X169 TaxID=2758572 RepID=UPI0015F43A1C|nr:bifunctional DNA primase/polymerase [Schaalia sp. JY-X169]